MGKRIDSLDDVPLVSAEEFFRRFPDVTGYFGGFGSCGAFVSDGYSEDFEPLIPLRRVATPDFPRDVLPGNLGRFAEELARGVQTPRAFTAAAALGTVSVACLRRWRVHVQPDWYEHAPFWVMPLLATGERKTPVINAIRATLMGWARKNNEQSEAERTNKLIEKQAYQKRAERLNRDAGNVSDPAELQSVIREAQEYARRAEEIEVPPEKSLFVSDVTGEALLDELDEQNGHTAIITDEGHQVQIMAGRYRQGGATDVENFCQTTHAGHIKQRRRGSGVIDIPHPEVSMVYAMQPEVLWGLENRNKMGVLGFFARCYAVLPQSLVGKRDERPEPMSDETRRAFERIVCNLLDTPEVGPGEHRTMRLSDEADRLLFRLQRWVERRSGHGKPYHSIQEWANKLVGYTCRIAMFLHAARWADTDQPTGDLSDTDISCETMRSAIKIGFFFLEHHRAIFETAEEDNVLREALTIVEALQNVPDLVISKRDLYRKLSHKFDKPTDMIPALERLVECNYVQVREARNPDGGPTSYLIAVNPLIRAGGRTPTHVPVTTSTADPSRAFFEWADGDDAPEPPPRGGPQVEKPNLVTTDKRAKTAKTPQDGRSSTPRKAKKDGKVVPRFGEEAPERAPLTKNRGTEKLKTPRTDEERLDAYSEADERLEGAYPLIFRDEAVDGILEWLETSSEVALDIETMSLAQTKDERDKLTLSFVHARVRLLTLSDGETSYVLDTELLRPETVRRVLEALHGKTLYLHNAIFDLPRLLKFYGVDLLDEQIRDTLVMSRVARSGELVEKRAKNWGRFSSPAGHGLGEVLSREGVAEIDKDTDHKWHEPLTAERLDYAIDDVRHLIALERVLMDLIRERDLERGLKLYEKVLPVYMRMQARGVPLDRERFDALLRDHTEKRDNHLRRVEELAPPHPEAKNGEGWSWGNKHKPDALDRHGNRVGRNGALRALREVGIELPSLEKHERIRYLTDHPAGAELLEDLHQYYLYSDVVSDCEKWLTYSYEGGRLYPNIHPFSQVTGRTGTRNPAIQNIPKEPLEGYEYGLRDCIKAPEGYQIVKADYAAQELRIVAEIAGDEDLVREFNRGDPHVRVAEQLVGRKLTEEDPEYATLRGLGKRINYGFSYGAGIKRYQEVVYKDTQEHITEDQARRDQQAFRDTWRRVAAWQRMFGSRTGEDAEHWYTLSFLGRRRYVEAGKPPKYDQRAYLDPRGVPKYTDRLNGPVQSGGADMLYTALLLLLEDRRKGLFPEVEILLTTHDEIALEAPSDVSEEAREWLEGRMRDAAAKFLRAELTREDCVEGEVRPSWGGR